MRRGVVVLPVLAALAVPAGMYEHYSLSRQNLQMHADGAAIYAARALQLGRDPRATVRNQVEKWGLALIGPPEIEAPPSAGGFAGDPQGVRVRFAARWRPAFLFGLLSAPMSVRATAAAVPIGGERTILRVE